MSGELLLVRGAVRRSITEEASPVGLCGKTLEDRVQVLGCSRKGLRVQHEAENSAAFGVARPVATLLQGEENLVGLVFSFLETVEVAVQALLQLAGHAHGRRRQKLGSQVRGRCPEQGRGRQCQPAENPGYHER